MSKVAIIDIGIGNISSLENIIKKIGFDSEVINTSNSIDLFDKIILPGVGSFDNAMKILKEKGFEKKLKSVSSNKHILGICLGMQLLFDKSEEGKIEGLGLIEGKVKKFDKTFVRKIPHMGWNVININKESILSKNIMLKNRFYFVHSYYCIPKNDEDIIFTAHYGNDFTCGVSKGNIYGVQFHPEKSHKFGMLLLTNFMEM